MNNAKKHLWMTLGVVATSWLAGPMAKADVVTDWNIIAGDIEVASKLPPPPTYRAMAIVQSAVYEASNAITKRYPPDRIKLDAGPSASVDAAVAAANRATLMKLTPSKQAAIDSAYQAKLSVIPDGPAKTAGITVGEQAAAAILALRAEDSAAAPESYRPHTTPGAYVPTVIPFQWPQRKPWIMTSADQFRPAPPPSLTSKRWARDYNEIKALGAKNSTSRSPEQTDIARFWADIMSLIYFPVVRSVANAPGREPTQNARLLAVAAQAIDDALMAVFDAKYHYNFWRPVTAIRNGDRDGNDATERDPSWVPFIDTPMHPEYPCAHCIVSGAVGAVLQAEVGTEPTPTLSTTSFTAPGMVRSWTKIDDFVQEVANARIYDGVHYRNSTEVGTSMGKKIGALAAAKALRP
jgi:PAP2 superfamily